MKTYTEADRQAVTANAEVKLAARKAILGPVAQVLVKHRKHYVARLAQVLASGQLLYLDTDVSIAARAYAEVAGPDAEPLTDILARAEKHI